MAQDDLVYCRTLTSQQGVSVTAGGQTITAGGQSITAGGQTITAGGQSITAGGQTITAGGLTVTGGASIDVLRGGVVAPTTSTGGTIATSGARIIKATVAASAQATNLTLATGSTGQEIVLINENTTGTSTMVVTGNIIVALGTTTATISGGAGIKLAWDDTQALWVKL
jgi:hypothetical protein